MKKISFIIILLSFSYMNSQKIYEFDYILEYEFELFKDSSNIKNKSFTKSYRSIIKYYLTNSTNNDYYAIISEKDSLNYQFRFTEYNGNYAVVNFTKEDFNKAEFLTIDCKYISHYRTHKDQVNNYDFQILNDTIIKGKEYGFYRIKSNNPKREKKKKLATKYYIIDKTLSFHLPILSLGTAYEEWKLHKNLPNGIFINTLYINYNGKIGMKETLIKYSKINKKLIISEDCDYSD